MYSIYTCVPNYVKFYYVLVILILFILILLYIYIYIYIYIYVVLLLYKVSFYVINLFDNTIFVYFMHSVSYFQWLHEKR